MGVTAEFICGHTDVLTAAPIMGLSLVLLRRSPLLLRRFLLLCRSPSYYGAPYFYGGPSFYFGFGRRFLVVRWQPPKPSRLEVDLAPGASRWPGFLAKSRGAQLLLKHFHEQMPYGLLVPELIEERCRGPSVHEKWLPPARATIPPYLHSDPLFLAEEGNSIIRSTFGSARRRCCNIRRSTPIGPGQLSWKSNAATV
jgi:hypothetical protein